MVGNLYDFHSHILPGMDDGCNTVQMAVHALKMSYAQGVRYLCATPHFYADESTQDFLARRQSAMDALQQAMEAEDGPFPEICLGAEVAYYPDISRMEGIERLCLGSSGYLLLEPPFCKWGSEVLKDLQALCSSGIMTPILAHIDRYWSLQNASIFQRVFSLDLQAQINGSSLLHWRTRGKAKRWIVRNLVQHIGSDCHNLTGRAPNLEAAFARLPAEAVTVLCENGVRAWESISGK